MEKNFSGKKVLVTGATGGIGQALCLAYARRGARVMIHSQEDGNDAAVLWKRLNRHGRGHQRFRADLSKSHEISKLFSDAGGIHVLVNNAGYCPKNPFLEIDGETLLRVLSVNFIAPFLASQLAARTMKKGASILFIASVDGFHPGQGRTHYGASKAAEINLMRNLALELAPRGIRVNAICPGAIDTPMISQIKKDPARKARVLKAIPQGRFGKPKEIAEAACFLTGSDCPYATGSLLTIDGGMTLVRGY